MKSLGILVGRESEVHLKLRIASASSSTRGQFVEKYPRADGIPVDVTVNLPTEGYCWVVFCGPGDEEEKAQEFDQQVGEIAGRQPEGLMERKYGKI